MTFLAIDHLNPKNDEQQSAIRQLLRTFERGYQKVLVACNSHKATDKCFKCGEEGHWANQFKKDIPHDPEWVKTQQCYKCGQTGHLKKDCKEASKGSNFKNPGKNTTCKVKQNALNNNNDLLSIQLLRLPKVYLRCHPKFVNLPNIPGEQFLQQGSDAWKQARRGKVNGSRTACALGWRGKQQMFEYAEEIKSGRATTEINDAMRRGSMCEDHAIATYVNGMPCKEYKKKKTGLWSTSDTEGCCWLGVSPDGLVDEDTVVEIKCPYMGEGASGLHSSMPTGNVCNK